MSGPPETRAAEASRGPRTVLFLVLALGMLGTCGIQRGVGALEADTRPEPVSIGAADEVRPETVETQRVYVDALWDAPARRPIAAANVLVSAMLLVGGLMLVARRKSAIWWVTQSLAANVVWTISEVASQVAGVLMRGDQLIASSTRELQAMAAESPHAGWHVTLLDGRVVLGVMIAMFVGLGLLRVAILAWLAWRARRPDVRRFIDEGVRERE